MERIDALEAITIVGSVINPKTRPPTSGADLGKPNVERKTDKPSKPKTIDGTAAKLFIFTSMKSVIRPGLAKYSRYMEAITASGSANITVTKRVRAEPTTEPNIPALSGSLESADVKNVLLNLSFAISLSTKLFTHAICLLLILLSSSGISMLNLPFKY